MASMRSSTSAGRRLLTTTSTTTTRGGQQQQHQHLPQPTVWHVSNNTATTTAAAAATVSRIATTTAAAVAVVPGRPVSLPENDKDKQRLLWGSLTGRAAVLTTNRRQQHLQHHLWQPTTNTNTAWFSTSASSSNEEEEDAVLFSANEAAAAASVTEPSHDDDDNNDDAEIVALWHELQRASTALSSSRSLFSSVTHHADPQLHQHEADYVTRERQMAEQREWCRRTASAFEQVLQKWASTTTATTATTLLQTRVDNNNNNDNDDPRFLLLSAESVETAVDVLLLGCGYTPPELAVKIRVWERCLGQLRVTPLTDRLSLTLLRANGQAGNVGRALQLLQLRTSRKYPPRPAEFRLCVQAIQAAQYEARVLRNPYVPESNNHHRRRHNNNRTNPSTALSLSSQQQPSSSLPPPSHLFEAGAAASVDNPTRWLDAILFNMSERHVPLTSSLANRMLECFTAGRTGKAVHFFYRVKRQGVYGLPPAEQPTHTSRMPHDWVHVPPQYYNNNNNSSSVEEEEDYEGNDDDDDSLEEDGASQQQQQQGGYLYQPIKVKVEYKGGAPPFYKVPAQARGKLFYSKSSSSKSPEVGQLKLEREMEPEYSLPLAAAFAFANSLQLGACGHPPLTLNTGSYNALIKACVYRGALWRAMHVLDDVMPQADENYRLAHPDATVADDDGTINHRHAVSIAAPDNLSYNLILSGLAVVGDVETAEQYYTRMQAAGLTPDKYTVRAVVDGLLNVGDAAGAVTTTQDFFNQYNILPPLATHFKILELCLGQGLVYEAKRYVYFIQQLWKWEPHPQYHSAATTEWIRATQRHPGLQRPALEDLFAYFGEELTDSDFLAY